MLFIYLGWLPNQNGKLDFIANLDLGSIVKILQPEVKYLFLRLNPCTLFFKPFYESNVSNGGFQIPVRRLQLEHALTSLEEKQL